MNKEIIYPSMVIRSQAEAIELLEKENQQLKEKIDKAIEYIKDSIYIPDDEDDMMFEKILSLTDNQIDELIEILDKKDRE